MSKTVKWILGVVLGLVALCAVAVVGFFAFSRLYLGAVTVRQRAVIPFEGPRNLPMPPFQGMPYRHIVGYSPFGFFGGWLIIAAALGLFALAVVALVLVLRRPGRPAMQSVVLPGPGSPSQPTGSMQSKAYDQPAATGGPGTQVQPPASVQPPAQEAAPEPGAAGQNCPNCGRSIQADWSHCPYCGTPLAGAG
jgi:hypothetical protein